MEQRCPNCGQVLRELQADRCPNCGEEGIVAQQQRRLRCRRLKRRCVWVFTAVLLLAGIVDGIVPVRGLLDIAMGTVLGLTCLAWCGHDANLHRRRTALPIKLLVIVLIPVGLGLYFVLRRRWRSLLKAFALGIVLTVSSALLSAISFRVCYGH
jgi:hypothetical protein